LPFEPVRLLGFTLHRVFKYSEAFCKYPLLFMVISSLINHFEKNINCLDYFITFSFLNAILFNSLGIIGRTFPHIG